MPRTEFERTEKQVDEASASGQLARVLGEKKELGQAQVHLSVLSRRSSKCPVI